MLSGITLRKWQERGYNAFEAALKKGAEQIYTVAAVGSGKTLYATVCAVVSFKRGDFDKIIIVCPQRRVKTQWAKTFKRFGININHKWNGGKLRGYDGISITYAGTVSALADLALIVDERTLVILDEIHHTSTETDTDVNAWGKAAGVVFVGAGFRIVLSGTPWRYTKEKVLFTPYVEDDDGRYWVVPDVKYTYGEAVQDKVNRPTKFKFFGGEVTLRKRGGKVQTLQFNELTSERIQRDALKVALDLSGDWFNTILEEFITDLLNTPEKNGIVPGGLIICKDQTEARRVLEIIKERYGIRPTIVLSDMAKEGYDPQKILDQFDTGRSRIIISVGMVTEGVDIPRLTHCLYLSNVLSSVFLWQVLGRIVRTLKPRLTAFAKMYLPELPLLLKIVQDIENDVLGVANGEQDKEEPEEDEEPIVEDEESAGVVRLSSVIALGSTGEHSFTVYKGKMYSPDELQVLQQLSNAGIKEIQEEELAKMLSMQQKQTSYIDTVFSGGFDSMAEEEETLRAEIKRAVGILAKTTSMSHRDIHRHANNYLAQYYKVDKLSTANMTVEQLRKKFELLNKKLAIV